MPDATAETIANKGIYASVTYVMIPSNDPDTIRKATNQENLLLSAKGAIFRARSAQAKAVIERDKSYTFNPPIYPSSGIAAVAFVWAVIIQAR